MKVNLFYDKYVYFNHIYKNEIDNATKNEFY